MVKMLRKYIRLSLLLLLILNIGIFLKAPLLNAAELPNTPEEAINQYLRSMTNEEFAKSVQFFSSRAKEKGGIFQKILNNFSILKQQRDFVISLFGKDAWMNVDYSIIAVKSSEAREQWVEKASRNVISEEEGREKLKEYWDNIGLKEGINSKDIFSNTLEEINGVVRDSAQLKLLKLKSKYKNSEPVEIQLVPYYSTYEIKLKFNGQDTALSGECNFHFSISNKNGKWMLYDGLSWTLPEVEPEGDI